MSLPLGVTLSFDLPSVSFKKSDFGLYIKLTKSASETPSVDVILS